MKNDLVMKTNPLKNLAAFLFIALIFYGCSDSELTLRPDAPLPGAAVPSASTPLIGVTTPWVKLPVPSDNPRLSKSSIRYTFKVNGAVYTFLNPLFDKMYKLDQNTEQWTPYDDIYHIGDIFSSYDKRYFTHGTKLYYGFDAENSNAENSLKSLDLVTGQTQVLASFPGKYALGLMISVVGSKVYVMGGSLHSDVFNQFWEYDINANHWTNKGTLPGGRRSHGIALVVGDKIYLGLGYDQGFYPANYLSDWYRINPATGAYTRLRDFPGAKRAQPGGSVFAGKMILGWGYDDSENLDDVWEYDVDSNDWKSIPKCPGLEEYGDETFFGLGGSVYVVRGQLKGFWKYNKLPWQVVN